MVPLWRLTPSYSRLFIRPSCVIPSPAPGPGIPATDRADVFEMFVRGKRESTQPGVGLGLAICRAVIDAHGGTIATASRLEGGACFLFTLPCGNPPEVEPELPGENTQHE